MTYYLSDIIKAFPSIEFEAQIAEDARTIAARFNQDLHRIRKLLHEHWIEYYDEELSWRVGDKKVLQKVFFECQTAVIEIVEKELRMVPGKYPFGSDIQIIGPGTIIKGKQKFSIDEEFEKVIRFLIEEKKLGVDVVLKARVMKEGLKRTQGMNQRFCDVVNLKSKAYKSLINEITQRKISLNI